MIYSPSEQTLLSNVYLIDSSSKFDRFVNLVKLLFTYFWSISILIKLIIALVIAPLMTIFLLYIVKKKKLSSYIPVFTICVMVFLLFLVTGQMFSISPSIIDSYAEKMSNEFSPNIYGYKYNFLDSIIKSLKDVYVTFSNILIILAITLIILIGNIYNLIFEDGTLFSFIESLVPYSIFLIYCYIYIENDIDWKSPSQMPKSTMYADFHNNTYINRNYPNECMIIIASKTIPEAPSKITWMFISLVTSFLLGICHLYWTYGSKDAIINIIILSISNIKEKFDSKRAIFDKIFDILELEEKNQFKFLNILIAIYNPIQIILVWIIYFNYFNDLLDASINILKNFDLCASVIRLDYESKNLKYISSVNNMSLYIDKYIYFEIPDNLLKTSEDLFFERKFNNLISFGAIEYAKELANSYHNEKIKQFCLNAINDPNNLLLKDINISFSKNCNSFVIGKENDEDVTISLLSTKGKIISLKAESGKGKSTINNFLNGDTRFLSSFINGHCSSLIIDYCKYLNPYYSQQHETFLDSFSVLDNLKIADIATSLPEIKYLLEHMGISKYYSKLNNLFGLTRFSSGQKDRIKMCRIFALMNNIIKSSLPKSSPKIKNMTIDSLSSDDHSNIEFIHDNLNLISFFVTLDEPFGALDRDSAISVMKLLTKYKEIGFTCLITDHSRIGELYADYVIEIKDKTCKYYVKVNEELIELSKLKFDDTNTLIIGDTIAYKHVGNRTKYNASNVMRDLQNRTFKGCDIYNLPNEQELLGKLNDYIKSNNNKTINSINDNQIDLSTTSVIINDDKSEINDKTTNSINDNQIGLSTTSVIIDNDKNEIDKDASEEYNEINNEFTIIY